MSAGTGWRDSAACADKPLEWFFPETKGGWDSVSYARGKAVCASCPVQLDCLREAQEQEIGFGLWGGLTARERGMYRRRWRRFTNDELRIVEAT